MDLLLTILLLLFCLLISNIVSHYLPSIPTALTQIATGVILALTFKNMTFTIETEWFLLLFVAPLLYNDGRHFPREELWEMRAPILGNAIILVVLTMLGGGYFIHWLISSIPLAAAFALAAILSPTDPVAVNGIAKRIQIPQQVLSLVRGESLINDATGLVAFNFAIAAVVTGFFSLQEAVLDFSYKFFAGIILGIVVGFAITWLRFNLRKQGIIDITFHSLLQILTPFIVYIITEVFLHASGVIAVVAAGIVHALVRERTETMLADEQVLTEHIWSITLFVLNGVVFLLLGLNIPSSMADAVADPSIDNWLLVWYVVLIGLVILGIRFAWSWLFFYGDYHFNKAKNAIKPDFITNLMISLTGVRGAVTMAGIMSTPLFLANGHEFPQRSLILFLSAGVIIFTLLVATLLLPLLSKRELNEHVPLDRQALSSAKRKILLETIRKIRLVMNDENRSVAYELIDEYRAMFKQLRSNREYGDSYQDKITEIRLTALKKEREYLHGLIASSDGNQAVFATLEKMLDHREEVLSTTSGTNLLYLIGKLVRNWKHYRFSLGKADARPDLANLELGKDIQLSVLQLTYKFLEDYAQGHENALIVYAVMSDYKRMMYRLNKPVENNNDKREKQKIDLRIKVMDMERAEIHQMFESGEITWEQAKELRRFVNNIESVTLYEHVE